MYRLKRIHRSSRLYLFTPVYLIFTPLWNSFSLPVSFVCQLTKENSPNYAEKKGTTNPRERIMPLEEGERFSSQLSKLEFRNIKILSSR